MKRIDIKEISVDMNQKWTLIHIERKNIKITLLNYGASIYRLEIPNQYGLFENIVIGYKDMLSYIMNKRHVNATIGPTAGRIENAEFALNGQVFSLDKNFEDKHNLHGGSEALSYSLFEYEVINHRTFDQVMFHLDQKPGKYPGTQNYIITYNIYDNHIEIEFNATTDTPTLVNLTNHAYFNLSGDLKQNILKHNMKINASKKMSLNSEMIPYAIEDITGTEYDFQITKPIMGNQLLEIDDPYILNVVDYDIPQVELSDSISKRMLTVYTTYPCIVCYTDNFPMTYDLMDGAENVRYMGVCFETQNPPNGIHINDVESSILLPKAVYNHKTRFVFSIDESVNQ